MPHRWIGEIGTRLVVVSLALSFNFPGFIQAEEIECSQVVNARERLACFDRQFPPDPTKPRVESYPYESPRMSPRAPAQTSVPAPSADTEPPAAASSGADDAPDTMRSERGMFDLPDDFHLESTIAAVRSNQQQKMVFRLGNDQIWIQDSPRMLRIREGDVVTITNATVGGYIMRTEGGVATRVHRIK